jgi:F5/8 type C domain
MPAREANPIAAPTLDIDGDNLLNLAYGASLVSRTAEVNLESSALHAIDGMSFTFWVSPPGAASQTFVYAFGGPSRVEQLGVTAPEKARMPESVRFSASSDAKTWREITTLALENKGTTLVDVPPFEARYLRVETIDAKKQNVSLASVHAIGRELRAAERHSFGGCWRINHRAARFTQLGARITGFIEGRSGPMYIDGGIEGRVAKLMWMRGPMWGYAAATLTPDGKGISAVIFHEEPKLQHQGEAWIGARCDADSSLERWALGPSDPADFLARAGHWTMSGLVFDAEERIVEGPSAATLDAAASLLAAAPKQPFAIIAREFRHNDPAENRRRAAARIDSLRAALRSRGVDIARIRFSAAGSDDHVIEKPSALQRMLWSRIDLRRL